MPVARIITTSPAESEELRRHLTAAGYSVKFAAPDEEFTDADIVVAAANVHSDYALQYAAEVAAEADADVIVAPGVVARTPAALDRERVAQTAPDANLPAAGILFGTANDVKEAPADSGAGIRETLGDYTARLGGLWNQLKHKRDLAAERKRLDREHREIERDEQRRVLQQRRAESEARMAVEREQLRARRQAEQERIRLEQEQIRRAMDQERARMTAERERMAQMSSLPASQPPAVPASVEPRPAAPAVTPPIVQPARTSPVRRPARPAQRRPARRTLTRQHRFQKAAFIASLVALVAMVGFAVAMNIRPSAPIPHSMVQNPVQEKSPFGAASITPATTTSGPAVKPVAKPVSRPALPQSDASPAKPGTQPTKPSPSRVRRRAAGDDYVAQDEVIIHHYGTQPAKHPPATQTRAGVRRYSDQD